MASDSVAPSSRTRNNGHRSRGGQRRRNVSHSTGEQWSAPVGPSPSPNSVTDTATTVSSITSDAGGHGHQFNQVGTHSGGHHAHHQRGRLSHQHNHRSYQSHQNRSGGNFNDRSNYLTNRPRVSPDLADWRNRPTDAAPIRPTNDGYPPQSQHHHHNQKTSHHHHQSGESQVPSSASRPTPGHHLPRVIRPSNTQRGGGNNGGAHRDTRFYQDLPPRFQKLQLNQQHQQQQQQQNRSDTTNLNEHRSANLARGPNQDHHNHQTSAHSPPPLVINSISVHHGQKLSNARQSPQHQQQQSQQERGGNSQHSNQRHTQAQPNPFPRATTITAGPATSTHATSHQPQHNHNASGRNSAGPNPRNTGGGGGNRRYGGRYNNQDGGRRYRDDHRAGDNRLRRDNNNRSRGNEDGTNKEQRNNDEPDKSGDTSVQAADSSYSAAPVNKESLLKGANSFLSHCDTKVSWVEIEMQARETGKT